MVNIEINKDKCIKCLKCLQVCPSIIFSQGKDSYPFAEHQQSCINCGHCVAICPEDAIIHSSDNNPKFFYTETAESSDILSFKPAFLHSKRSQRFFIKKEIPVELLHNIVSNSETAPSAENARKRKYIIVTDKEVINSMEAEVMKKISKLQKALNPFTLFLVKMFAPKLKDYAYSSASSLTRICNKYKEGANPIFRDAPALIFTAAPKRAMYGEADCVAAATYGMLYAHSLQVESCVIGFAGLAQRKINKLLKLPSGYTFYSAVVYGYPKYIYEKNILQSQPDISEI